MAVRLIAVGLAALGHLGAAQFSIRVVDGLDRPLSGVNIDVSCFPKQGAPIVLDFISGPDGEVKGACPESSVIAML